MMTGEGMHRDCTHVGETQHSMLKHFLYIVLQYLYREHSSFRMQIYISKISVGTCLRMEQKCLLFIFSTLRTNL